MDAAISRHFVTVDGAFGRREVHFRRAGAGPVVMLLHQSPQSSREMEALMHAWSHAFTLIAPDTPGYGFSAPLRPGSGAEAGLGIDDFATATLELADHLGLARFGVYGFHTGASIGTAMAAARPDRVAAVAANGLVMLRNDEREAILREYLPPLEPRWDGGHLAWLWARLREQTIFFPWHDRRAATRLDFDVPSPERLQAALEEFLAAGDHHADAYFAAFTDQAGQRLPVLRSAVLVTASAQDPLAGHLGRIGPRSASVSVAVSANGAAALDNCFAHLRRHPGDVAPPLPAILRAAGNAGGSSYQGATGRQVRLLHTPARTGGKRHTVVLLHPPGQSADGTTMLAHALAAHADVIAADLPGHGASDRPHVDADSPGSMLTAVTDQLAAALVGALANPAPESVVLAAIGSSAPLARRLHAALGLSTSLVLVNPPCWTADDRTAWLKSGLPALAPVWSGGHLLEAWHMVRDGRLFSPWFRRDPAGIRAGEPDLDDRRIHDEVRDLLRAGGAWQPLMRDLLLDADPVLAEPATITLSSGDDNPPDWPAILKRTEPAR